jgi:hypothetical protein
MATPRLNLTPLQAALMIHHALRLSRPPREMPPIVPGVVHRLAEDPRDPDGVDRLHRRLFGER